MSNKIDETLEQAVILLLEGIGVDLSNPGVADTPKRFVKALKSFSPNKEEPVVTMFPSESKGVVTIKNLELRSLCQHHLFPFFGSCSVAYIPNGYVAGLSKFQRVLDFFAERPQDQENITHQVLEYLVAHVQPKAMVVMCKATHTCMTVRGVKCHNGETITIESYGTDIGDKIYENLIKSLQ